MIEGSGKMAASNNTLNVLNIKFADEFLFLKLSARIGPAFVI